MDIKEIERIEKRAFVAIDMKGKTESGKAKSFTHKQINDKLAEILHNIIHADV